MVEMVLKPGKKPQKIFGSNALFQTWNFSPILVKLPAVLTNPVMVDECSKATGIANSSSMKDFFGGFNLVDKLRLILIYSDCATLVISSNTLMRQVR